MFVLSKADLNDAIAQYPQAQAILKRRAQSVMRKNAARERKEASKASPLSVDVVISNPKTPPSPPKLLETVIKALPEESAAVQLLTRGSRRVKRRRISVGREHTELPTITKNETPCLKVNSNNNEDALAPSSPDLLSSIQMALAHQNMNLTDTEKALIVGPNSPNDFKSDFLDPNDGRMECFELENLAKLNGGIDYSA